MSSLDRSRQQTRQYVSHACYQIAQRGMKSYRISHPGFSNEDAEKLASALSVSKKLRKLDIVKCPSLTGEGIATIFRSLKYSNVSHVSLEGVSIGDEGLQSILHNLLENEIGHIMKLRWLGLEENGPVSDKLWQKFFKIASWKLESLDLSRNSLNKDHVVTIAEGITARDGLGSLVLSENPIGDDGMELLCQGLQTNRSLQLLAVGQCNLSDRSISALTKVMRQNCKLQRLYTFGNPNINSDSADYVELQYWLQLNNSGRSLLRSEGFCPSFLPKMLSKSKSNPDILFGLLRDLPHTWIPN